MEAEGALHPGAAASAPGAPVQPARTREAAATAISTAAAALSSLTAECPVVSHLQVAPTSAR